MEREKRRHNAVCDIAATVAALNKTIKQLPGLAGQQKIKEGDSFVCFGLKHMACHTEDTKNEEGRYDYLYLTYDM